MFGTLNTQLIYQLAGNTQATKNVRTVTKSNDPKGQAVWTIKDLDNFLEEYFFNLYEGAHHTGIDKSPAQAFADGMKIAGDRPSREIKDYAEFLMWTLPTTSRAKAKVQPASGVRIHYIAYWCDEFRGIENTKVPVRFDPENIGIAYAWVNNRWVKCVSAYYHILRTAPRRNFAWLPRRFDIRRG